MAEEGSDPRVVLTVEQRAQLRPTVAADALEQLLGRVPRPVHAFLLLLCSRAPTAARWQAAVAELRAHGDARSDLPDGDDMPRFVGNVRFNDAELDALWQAVEPGRAA
jgi:hypothetical protein